VAGVSRVSAWKRPVQVYLGADDQCEQAWKAGGPLRHIVKHDHVRVIPLHIRHERGTTMNLTAIWRNDDDLPRWTMFTPAMAKQLQDGDL
jgi:hypothetical protein